MRVHSPHAFRNALATLAPTIALPPLRGILTIRPDGFRLSDQAVTDNVYMASGAVDPVRALAQHVDVVARLRSRGIEVLDLPGDPTLPDACFCNNAFGTVADKVIFGAMRHLDRREEPQRPEIHEALRTFGYNKFHDVVWRPSSTSTEDVVAELTGSLVIDHRRRIGYLGWTDRVNELGAQRMFDAFRLQLMYEFPLTHGEYHTNVVLAILSGRAAVIAADGFARREDAEVIAEVYGEQVLWLTPAQKHAFAGNLLSIGESDVFMSTTAAEALGDEGLAKLNTWGFEPQAVQIDELEKGGGSMRCLLCELW